MSGLGSIKGTLLRAVLIGLMSSYLGLLAPQLASNMIRMVASLLWKPNGLRPMAK